MKKFVFIALSCFMVFACKEKNPDTEKNHVTIVPVSNGRINHVSVIVSNEKWNDSIGEAIRDVLAAPVDGLPQEEPLFSIKQMPVEAFKDFATKSRLILVVDEGKPIFKIEENVYAKPQKVAVVKGNTNEEVINLLKENGKKIVSSFKETELTEKQRRINLSLHNIKGIQENLGITINFPSAYRVSDQVQKPNSKFFWARKNIPTGSMNLLFYEVPMSTIKKGDSIINNIIKMRDSIGEQHIPGPVEGSYQITEKAYAPYLYEKIEDNKPTYVTKGTWEVKGATMAGPFVNYAIEDKLNNRYVILEGFTYSPSVQKRDFMFELEAIIKSVHVK